MKIDGKTVYRYLFMRYSHLQRRNIPVEVHAFNPDHAVTRLHALTGFAPKEWEMVQKLEDGEFLGKLGEKFELNPLVLKRETN